MYNSLILYCGMYCLAMIFLGAALTTYEFKKITNRPAKKPLSQPTRDLEISPTAKPVVQSL